MATDPSQLIASLVGMPGLIGQQTQQNMLNSQQYALGQQQQQANVLKLQAAQAELGQQAQYQQDVSSWASAGAPAQGLTALIAKYPDQYKALQAGWQVKDDAQRTADLGYWGGVHAALQKGNTALATKIIQDRITAEQKAGMDTAGDQQLLEGIQKGDRTAIDSVKGFSLAQIAAATGPAKFADTYDAVGEQDKSFTLTPGAKRFDAQGNVIASAPAAVHYERIQTVDADGNPVTQVVAVGGEGGGQASGGNGPGVSGPVDRLINSDAGGGYVPDSVKTLGQFVTYGKSMNARGAKSSSAGRYQINGSTMAEFAPQALGPDWRSQPFDGASQEKVGAAIFNWAKQQRDPAAALKGRWVSLTNDEARRLVQGDWSQARGLIAQKETGGAPGASAARQTGAGGAQVLYSAQGQAAGNTTLGDPSLSGEAYLQSLPLAVRAKVKAVAEGRAAAPRPGTKFGEALLGAVTQYDPTFDAANAMTRVKTRTDFTSGKSAQAVNALNTAMGHLFHLDDQIADLKNVSFLGGIINPARRAIQNGVVGGTAYKSFDQTKQAAASEMRKVFAGAGGGNLTELKEWQESFDSANSPEQLHAAVKNGIELMGSRLQALQDQYATGMGRSDQIPQLIKPSVARAARTRFGVDLGGASAPRSSGFRILSRRPK